MFICSSSTSLVYYRKDNNLNPVIIDKTYKNSQYHYLEDYDFPVNKDSLYTLNSFYNENLVTQLYQQSQQLKFILDTGSNVSLINKRLISKEMKNHVHKTKAKINFPLLDVKEDFVEQVNNEIHTFFIIEFDTIDVLFVGIHGYPRTIVSDRDPRFLSDIWGRWTNTKDSKLKMTVAHRSQADGQTERMNREIKEY
ncbi:hypothetical protein ACTFIR_009356 [Dictyostelium discoideum]